MSTSAPDAEVTRKLRDAIDRRRNLPESTYRLQFHARFTFRDATTILPYLRELGITHVYASPYLKARAGSTHGYDVTDHHALNPEIGTQAEYETFLAELKRNGLAHILDTVPNHVGVGTNNNAWWNDVLENGPSSRFASFFDISWHGSQRPELRDKLLLPLLGKPYGEALEAGELQLKYEDGRFAIDYYDRRFPISPRTIPADLTKESIARFNGTPGQPETFDRLDKLLTAQAYRLAYWRVAPDEINYRRFFDINDLAAITMERKEVFESTHELIIQWLGRGTLQGLRIDHPDGLYDPKQYFLRLQQAYLLAVANSEGLALEPSQAAAIAEQLSGESPAGWPLYVTVEKILAIGEPLPGDWAVHGTSGYDFLDMVNGLFVQPKNEAAFSRIYQKQVPDGPAFEDLVYEKKRLILRIALASELHMLAHRLDRLAQADRRWRDFTQSSLREALGDVVACFPVYRSYVSEEGVRPDDCRYVDEAIQKAVARNPATEPSVFHFIRDMVLQQASRFFTDQDRADQLRFAGKFQQLTAPATAKGIEDTSFYIYNRLISLNEVGGEPSHFGISSDALHAYLSDRQTRWPFALSPLSTHDTKRSEDVRARINVLSEVPAQWEQRVAAWREINSAHRPRVAGVDAPDANDEYLLYQTLIGAFPVGPYEYAQENFVSRIQAYMEKAIREAKVHTSWTRQNEGYEKAIKDFVAAILRPGSEFLRDFIPFQARISQWGMLNSLSQTLLRLTAPGVPDTYQGTELWDFTLVDPDNRRPVDYEFRKQMLHELKGKFESQSDCADFARQLIDSKDDGRAKLLVTWLGLQQRRAKPGLFTLGAYRPVRASGANEDNVFAFTRRLGTELAVVAIPRFGLEHLSDSPGPMPLENWKDTHLAIEETSGQRLRNIFTGESIRPGKDGSISASEAFKNFPVALLTAE